jgi:hypothetical protein
MLMSDAGRHTLSTQARALLVSLDAQDQPPQKGGMPNPTEKSAQINYPQESQDDHKNLKYLTSIYTGILKTESLQTEARSTPPKLGGNIDASKIVEVFREWNLEYEHGKMVLQNCRNEFLNRAQTQTSQHFKLSNYFLLHTLDGRTEQWNKRRMYANPEEWFRPKDVLKPLPAVKFWRRQIKNAESIFLQRHIDIFVKIINSRIAQAGVEGGEDEFGKLGLIEFQFGKIIVGEWADFCTNKPNGRRFPRLPEQCVRTASSDKDFRKHSFET